MADIYAAQLNPGKLEVITDWVAAQNWAAELDLDGESAGTGHRRTASMIPPARSGSKSTSSAAVIGTSRFR
jgi:hypothetical protein